MAIDLITGHQGVAHISAEQIAELQRSELGGYGDNKVMRMIDGGVTYSGLTITVAAGYWRVNGYDMQIQEAEEILIDPTAAGYNRIDKVYATILQDIPSGVQRSELRVVQGEESASTPTAPTKPTAPILNTDELLQIEEVCTVTVSDGAMTFQDDTIPYRLANPEDITETQQMIAPIEAGPTASQAYAVGKQLVYNGLLYKVTSAIAQGDTLTVGTNIALSDDVTTQLLTLKNQVPKYGTSSTAASTTAKTASTTDGDFVLQTGAVVRVKFTYNNTASTPTLNIDSTGAHDIKAYNTTKPDVYWKAGDVVEFTYDGSNFIMGPTEGQITDLNASLTSLESNSKFSDVSGYSYDESIVQNINSIIKINNLCIIVLTLKFSGKATNTEYNAITGLPKAVRGVYLSVPNEYGNTGTVTLTMGYNSTTLKAKCSHANSYYYAEIIYPIA